MSRTSLAPQIEEAPQFGAESTTVRTVVRAVSREDLQPFMYLVHQAVARVLRKLPPSVQRDDLFAAGSYGLMDALRRHGGERGPEFEWYARVRIRGAIFDELRNQDWLSRSARAEATAAQEPDGDGNAACVSIVGFDDLPEHKRLMPAAEEESPLDLAERNSQRTALGKAVSQLPEREARIVEMHYFQGMQFKEIAQMMKVSEPRISQLHARAMGMMRKILEAEGYAA